MYTRYFGLTETPFAISPNPRYLYMSELHREALAHLLYGLTSDGCMILLTGDIGTGKTTLCRCLLEKLPEKTDIAVILNPRLTARDLLKTICEEFGILPPQGIASMKTYVDIINQYLLKAHANDRSTALIIDEAQNLDINVLEQLRLLTNLETNTKKLLRIILIGQPELRDLLERPELIQVNQRITSRYHLAPLQPADVRKYILHRLHVAGDNTATLFSEKAIQHAIRLTGGIPRLINVLCDRALLGAYAINADHVDIDIMKRAGKEIFPKKPFTLSGRAKALLLGAFFLICLAIPALVFIPGREEKSATPEPLVTADAIETKISNTETDVQTPLTEEQESLESLSEPLDEPAEEQPETAPLFNEEKVSDNEAVNSEEVVDMPLSEVTPAPPAAKELVEAHLPPEPEPEPEDSKVAELVSETPITTISVSAPLLVLKKAGPVPQKTVAELITR